ncbi:MAG: TetR/AcrR family transcriptional regulator [Bacteroidales bacterium]|nr:TetR/AcrR family transcriptional regulator [Bacteroidales bacterium]MDD4683949.1 TetR/AcrR family transcriptional regulator [Bacteroidales bacterium]
MAKLKEVKGGKEGMEFSILHAADELFMERGFNGVSTTEIALKVGCNQALIHYYYRTKANLFQKVFENKLSFLISLFEVDDYKGLSFEDKLRMRIESHFDALAQNPKLPMFVLNELKNNPITIDLIKETFNNNVPYLTGSLEKELQEEHKAGRIRKISALDLMINITSLNIFTFLTLPIMEYVFGLDQETTKEMFEVRKKEIVTTVLNSIRPI